MLCYPRVHPTLTRVADECQRSSEASVCDAAVWRELEHHDAVVGQDRRGEAASAQHCYTKHCHSSSSSVIFKKKHLKDWRQEGVGRWDDPYQSPRFPQHLPGRWGNRTSTCPNVPGQNRQSRAETKRKVARVFSCVFCSWLTGGTCVPPWQHDPVERGQPSAGHSHERRAEGSLGCGLETDPGPGQRSRILIEHPQNIKQHKKTTPSAQ